MDTIRTMCLPTRRWTAALLLASAQAAAQPLAAPQWMELAARHEYGEGMPRDLGQARALYCRAARLGHAGAQYALGWMLANGRGGPRDDGAASQLFALAAAQGHRQAETMLAYTHATPGTPLPACMLPDLALPALQPEQRTYYLQGPGKQVAILVDQLAPEFGIDPQLAMAFIAIESGFDALAVSPRRAQGLMQLIPETAERFRVKDAFDPEQNIRGGLAYLRWLLAYFKGDVQLVAAAYNAGEKAVDRYRGVPPYAETSDYVKKLARRYPAATHPYQRGAGPVSPLLAAPSLPPR